MHEVVVIGGGTAGTFATLRLARAGVDVALVTGGPPSALMCGGAAFVRKAFPEDDEFGRLWEAVFPRMCEGPDTFVGFEGSLLEAARGFAGAARRSHMTEEDVLVMDVPGLPGPDASVLGWSIGERLQTKIRCARLKLQYSADDFALTPVGWARRFDDGDRRATLVSHLLRRLMDEPADVVLVPPIMGIEFHAHLMDILGESAPGRVMELLGGPGWPPGLRLARCLDEALRDGDVIQVHDRVVGGRVAPAGRDLRTVVTQSGEEIEADHFVLATGHVLGGGIRFEDDVREAALGLPLLTDGVPVAAVPAPGRVDPSLLFDEHPAGDHAILRTGVMVDDGNRPVDAAGRVVYTNLLACGGIVSPGPESILDPGWSAWDGFRAAGKLI